MLNKRDLKEESKWLKPLSWVLVIMFLMGAAYLVDLNANVFQTSLLTQKIHKPFDGTVMPVQKTPDWVKLSGDEWDYSYDKLSGLGKITDAPKYDPKDLAIPVSSLVWKNQEHDKIRNEKITYSVPYMGNYQLSGMENVGSHLAVDIKIPNGTPVYAIANGIIDKAALQSSGFGKHIVIRHNNFPTLGDENKSETFYSSYSHLGEISVAEGDVVEKGQQIGLSGATGTATTPHLHFQIDNDLAPWHPFWPFTYQESVNAGYSFFEAINFGLGKERGLANTVNPMMYVQKYLNYIKPADETVVNNEVVEESFVDTSIDTSTDTPVDTSIEPETPKASYKFEHDSEFEVGKPEKIKFSIEGDYPFEFSELIVMSAFTGDAEFGKKLFSGLDYINSGFEFYVTPTGSKTLRIQATLGGETIAVSDPLNVKTFTDVSESNPHYDAIRYLYSQGVITGYGDGTFKPDATVTRAEALKMILSGIQKNLENTGVLPFSDVVSDAWYSDYVSTAYEDGIVNGYPDGTFGPGNTVNKAEFFKILLLAMEVDVDPNVSEEAFKDVDPNAWFAPYVKFVKDKNLLDVVSGLFGPQDGMTRGDVAEAMFRVMIISKTSADKFSTNLVEGIVM